MAIDLFADAYQWTVTAGGNTAPVAGTSEAWTVASSTGAPAASNSSSPPTAFRIVDASDTHNPPEIMLVTNVSGTAWTVTRGAEGTQAPFAHGTNFTVIQVLTASSLTEFQYVVNDGGTIYLRPNGPTSTTGQITLATADGSISTPGQVTVTKGIQLGASAPGAAPDIHSDGTNIYIESSTGSLYIRPGGLGVSTNQSQFDASGNLIVAGATTTNNGLNLGNGSTGTVNPCLYNVGGTIHIQTAGAGHAIVTNNNTLDDGSGNLIAAGSVSAAKTGTATRIVGGTAGKPGSTAGYALDDVAVDAAKANQWEFDGTAWQPLMPPGSVMPYAGISLPAGWLWCDGSSYLKSTYPDLFNALTIQTTANTHTTTTIDGLSASVVAQLQVGWWVSGTALTVPCTITAILSSTSIQVSQAAASTVTGTTVTFFPFGAADQSANTFQVPDLRGRSPIGGWGVGLGGSGFSNTNTYDYQVNHGWPNTLAAVGFWELNEASGTAAADSATGHSNTGTYTGSPTLGVTGPLASMPLQTGITLNGTSQYVAIPYSLSYDLQQLTVECWASFTNPSGLSGGLWEKTVGGTVNTGYLLFYTGGGLFWRVIDSGGTTHDVSWAGFGTISGGWHHIVGTYNQSNLLIYVDGDLVGSASPGALTLKTGSGTAQIGQLYNGWFHSGSIALVAIYSGAMSAQQVRANYRAGIPYALGSTGGEERHILTSTETVSHSHTITDPNHNHTGGTGNDSPDHSHTDAGHTHNGGSTGGESATHFHTPDTGGNQMIIAFSSSTVGLSTASIGTKATATVDKTSTNNVDHTHGIGNGVAANGGATARHTHSVTSGATGITQTNNTGGTGQHNTLSPYMGMNFIIKV